MPGSERRTAVAAASIGMFAATVVWRFFTFTGFTNDHYAHLALAQQMLLGERPIRDFSDPGWPLTYVISAAGWRLAGGTMAVEWGIVTVGFALGAALTVIAAHRLSGSLTIAILAAALEALILPRTYSYPKMLVYAGAACAILAVAARPSSRRVIGLGAVTAIAFLMRHDHGAYTGVASAVCVMLATVPEWRMALHRTALLTLTSSAIVAPWVLYVALNGGLTNYFDRALEYARIEANATTLKTPPRFARAPGQHVFGLARPNRPLAQVEWTPDTTGERRQSLEKRYGLEPVREEDGVRFYYVHDATADNIRALADDEAVAGSVGLGRVQRGAFREFVALVSPLRLAPALHTLQNAQAWLYWLFWILPVVAAVVAGGLAFLRRERWPGELAAVGGLIVMALLVNSGFLRDPLSARLADSIVLPALLGAWLAGNVWTRGPASGLVIAARALSIVLLFVTTIAVGAVAELPERIEYTGVWDGMEGVRTRASSVSQLLASSHRQVISPPSRQSAALMPFFSYLDRCTSPSEQLILTGDYADVMVLAGRGFASDGVSFGVWYSSVAHQAETVAGMRARPALFAIMVDEHEFDVRYPKVADYIAQDYGPMTDISVDGAGPMRILVHRQRTPSSTDPETGWPCFR